MECANITDTPRPYIAKPLKSRLPQRKIQELSLDRLSYRFYLHKRNQNHARITFWKFQLVYTANKSVTNNNVKYINKNKLSYYC